jgi:uncharacterized circularly permuted ATP-grasp superfamily protein/uncharacterized alpha-E superfamily protein
MSLRQYHLTGRPALYPTSSPDDHVDGDGLMHGHWAAVCGAVADLDRDERRRRMRAAGRLATAMGAAHVTGSTSIPTLDPLPAVIDPADWSTLRAGVVQRVRLHNRILDDLYGERHLVRAGVLAVGSSLGTAEFEPAAVGWPTHGPRLSRYAVDIVRLVDGTYRVVEEHTDAPEGAGVALMVRSVLARTSPELFVGLEPLGPFFTALRRSVGRATSSSTARVVVLAAAYDHRYVEHAFLATQLGYNVVTPDDLTVHRGRVCLRAVGGLEPIDVIIRAIDSDGSDPLETGLHTTGVAGLVQAAREDAVALSNAIGAGVAARLGAVLAELCPHLLNEPLQLPAGGADDPLRSTMPLMRVDGEVVPGLGVMRLHATFDGERVTVMRGGLAHTSSGDTTSWKAVVVPAVGRTAKPPVASSAGVPVPIDLSSSLPTRAAEALFWVGRNAERAEIAARAAQTVRAALADDPSLDELAGGTWIIEMVDFLGAASGTPAYGSGSGQGLADALADAVSTRSGALADSLAHLVRGASTVREFLSTATWRVMASLETDIITLSEPVDDATCADVTERVLFSLAALAGLAQESVVRGPSWRFLDLGRRVDRATLLVRGLAATMQPLPPGELAGPIGEVVLAANESLVAYRRRYRTDVDPLLLLTSLLTDGANPRSLRFQLMQIAEHLQSLADLGDVVHSTSALQRCERELAVDAVERVDLAVLSERLDELDESIRVTWFAGARERRV